MAYWAFKDGLAWWRMVEGIILADRRHEPRQRDPAEWCVREMAGGLRWLVFVRNDGTGDWE